MLKRSPFLSSTDAPLATGLVIGWGVFIVFVAVGIVIALRLSSSSPILLGVTSR